LITRSEASLRRTLRARLSHRLSLHPPAIDAAAHPSVHNGTKWRRACDAQVCLQPFYYPLSIHIPAPELHHCCELQFHTLNPSSLCPHLSQLSIFISTPVCIGRPPPLSLIFYSLRIPGDRHSRLLGTAATLGPLRPPALVFPIRAHPCLKIGALHGSHVSKISSRIDLLLFHQSVPWIFNLFLLTQFHHCQLVPTNGLPSETLRRAFVHHADHTTTGS